MKKGLKIDLIGIYLLIFLVSLIVVPIQAYRSSTLDPVLRSLTFVGSAGGLGGTIYCIRGYYKARNGGRFNLNFSWWYIYRPFVSIVAGVFAYFLILGGLLTLTVGDVSQAVTKGIPLYCVISFLAGFAFTEFADALTGLAASKFEPLGKKSNSEDTGEPDYPQRFKAQLQAIGLTFSDLKKVSDNKYGGTSTVESQTNMQWTATIETFNSEDEAKVRYDQLTAAKKTDGYNVKQFITPDFSKINTIKKLWTGSKSDTDQCGIYYTYEGDIKQGVVTTLTSGTVDSNSD